MSKRKPGRRPGQRKSRSANVILAIVTIGSVLVVASGLIYLVRANTRPKPEASVAGSPGEPLRLPTPAGRDRSTTFDVPDHVGERAPAFTAIGVDGQPYTVTPGDSRPKAIIFYMGYG